MKNFLQMSGEPSALCPTMNRPKRRFLIGLACGVALLAPSHSYAALIDGSTLNIDGSATVGATFLNWGCNAPGGPSTCPANPDTAAATGDFAVSDSTGSFAQYNGTFGFVTDISQATAPLNTVVSIQDFITFALNGNETIELTFIPLGTDTPSTTCAGLTNCTPEIGDGLVTASNPLGLSSFNLNENGTGTAASFGVEGVIIDSSGATAPITGTYTAQFNGDTPEEVLGLFAAAGTSGLPSTYSAQFSFNIVPEPMGLSLTGLGLIGLGLLRRVRRS